MEALNVYSPNKSISLSLRERQSDHYADVYFETFLVALFVNLLPSKILGIVSPLIVLAWFIIRSHSGKAFKKLMLVLLFFILMIAFYAILYHYQGLNFLFSSAVVSWFTYGGFIVLFCMPGSGISQSDTYLRYAKVLRYVILLEGLIGIFQFLIVKLTGRFNILPGDAVQGTIGLLAFVYEDSGFGNQMYVINMVFFIVLYLPYVMVYRRDYIVVLIGLISVMLAAVMHVFIGLIWAFLFTVIFFRKNFGFGSIFKILSAFVVSVALLIPFEFFFPGITKTASIFISLYEDKKSPKFEAIENALYKMPDKYPSIYVVGLGPGQYSSRAGLMSSGRYFSSKTSLLPNTTSQPFKVYFQRIWLKYTSNPERYGNSTMHRPFFSLLSVFTEFGILGFVIIIGVCLTFFIKARTIFIKSLEGNKLSYLLAFCFGTLIISLFFISLFENYLETTQAILPGLMLLKVFYAYLCSDSGVLNNEINHYKNER